MLARKPDRPTKKDRDLAEALGWKLCTHDLTGAEEHERDDGSFRWYCDDCDGWIEHRCVSCGDTLPGRRPKRGVCQYCRKGMKPTPKPVREITFIVPDGWDCGFDKAERAIEWLEANGYKVYPGHIPG